MYFLLHLDSMHPNDHNALEKYINDNVSDAEILEMLHQNTIFFIAIVHDYYLLSPD